MRSVSIEALCHVVCGMSFDHLLPLFLLRLALQNS